MTLKKSFLMLILALAIALSLGNLAPATAHAASQKTQVTHSNCGTYPLHGAPVSGKDDGGNVVALTLWTNICTGDFYGVVDFFDHSYSGILCINVRVIDDASEISHQGGSVCRSISGSGEITGFVVNAGTNMAQATFSGTVPGEDLYIATGWY